MKLLFALLGNVCFSAMVAYLLGRSKHFRDWAENPYSFRAWLWLSIIFSALGIISCYYGVKIFDALASTRIVGTLMGGIIGGPYVGTTVGVITGLHRYSLGGFTAFSCGMATVIAGVWAGLVRDYLGDRAIEWRTAAMVALVAEIIQKLLTLLLAKPFDQALAFEKAAAFPTIMVSIIGTVLFVIIIQDMRSLANQIDAQKAIAELGEQKRLREQAEFKALQSQINPHFIFNTLSIIMSLCRTNPDEARQLLASLSEMLHFTFARHDDLIPVEDEFDSIVSLLNIVQHRFGTRLRVNAYLDPECEGYRIPAFTLQPFVENAVQHGLFHKTDHCIVNVEITRDADKLKLLVSDNGMGMSAAKCAELLRPQSEEEKAVKPRERRHGIGVYNVHERLRGLYKNKASLSIISREGEGTTIIMLLPWDRGSHEDSHSNS